MADTVREQILADIVTTVQGITTGNGYEITIPKVVRIPTNAFQSGEYPVASIQELSQATDDGARIPNIAHVLMDVGILVWHQDFDKISSKLSSIYGSVYKALHVDVTRGNLAIDTNVIGDEVFVSEGDQALGGIQINAQIMYRHLIGDPYTKR